MGTTFLKSILDNDFYKFTMQHAVIKLFPKAKVRYGFINRGKHIFPEGFADLLRRADAIFIEELINAGWYEKTSQAFTVFLPVKSVGVMGDGRTYEYVVALRAVVTSDFMTAHWAELPYSRQIYIFTQSFFGFWLVGWFVGWFLDLLQVSASIDNRENDGCV